MRVLLVVGTTGGGVGRHVRALATSLTEAGHQVTVAGPAATDRDHSFSATGAAFVPVEVSDRPQPLTDTAAVRELRRLRREVDVVHAHGLRAGGLAVLARSVGGRRDPSGGPPVVVTLHNALLARGVRGGPVRAAYAVLERLVARGADVCLGVSQDLVDRLEELGATRVALAVVPAPPARPAQHPASWTRAALGIGADRPLVLTVARLAEQKGLHLLLDVAAALQARVPPPVLVVAGDGPLHAALQSRIDADRLPVRLLGARDDVPDLLAAADVALSTAVWEGQPIFVQEALRAGVPLVATDVGGTRAATGDAAVLAPYGDAAALAGGVAALLDDPAARADLAARARHRAAELPTDEDARDAALDVYREVCPEPV